MITYEYFLGVPCLIGWLSDKISRLRSASFPTSDHVNYSLNRFEAIYIGVYYINAYIDPALQIKKTPIIFGSLASGSSFPAIPNRIVPN
jgi:hypothetical protein